MEQQGWVKFQRNWRCNPYIYKDGDHMAVWMLLMLNATHTEMQANFGKEVITLKAGQLLVSQREIAEKLKINRGKVDRIFALFKSVALIVARTNMQQSLVTIEHWADYQRENVARNVAGMWHECGTLKETENEKEKRSKREKDKEKEINKNERMKENIYPPYIPPLGEKGRDDFSLNEKDLDKWLEEDDGIDDWDKMQIYYKNLNSGQQLAVSSQQSAASSQQECHTGYDKTNGLDNTNPISKKNKVYNELHPHTPSSCEANRTEGVHGITQEACMESTHRVVWNQPQGCMDFNPVNEANPYPQSPDPYPLSPDPCTMFDEFWQAYPKKVGKGYAFECFKKIKPSQKLLDTMLEAIKKQKKSDMWKRDKGQYIPNPSTWLNQKRWEDDLGGDDDGQIPWSEMKLPGTYL